MANIKIIDLPTGSPESTSFIEATQVDELAESGRSTVKLALNALGNFVAGQDASPLEYGDLETESTTLIGGINELHDSIGADAYDDTATYNTGDYCIHNGGLYKCNDDNVTGAWSAAKWDSTILVDELGGSGSSLVLPESIADEYDDTASYTAGDFVMYQGILYKCNHISATGSFDPTKWDAISATDYINSVNSSLTTNINQLAGDISDAYSSSRTYAVGDLCILGNLLYKCNTAITTPEAWTPAHWTTTTVKAELALLNSNKADKGVSNSVTGTLDVAMNSNAFITYRIAQNILIVTAVFNANSAVNNNTQIAHISGVSQIGQTFVSSNGDKGTAGRFKMQNGNIINEFAMPASEYFSLTFVSFI